MIERASAGELPDVPHTVFRGADGDPRYEHCLTREGFDGPYSILYHLAPPHGLAEPGVAVSVVPMFADDTRLRKRHLRTASVTRAGDSLATRMPLLFSDDVIVSVATPTEPDGQYLLNGDADELVFVREGRGLVRSVFGDLPYGPGDYVAIPKGVLHRVVVDASLPSRFLVLELSSLGIPQRFRNAVGQLRMDAPYGARDVRRPVFVGPLDEGIRSLVVKRGGAHHTFALTRSPLDVVGWDGSVFPWAMSITRFRPRVGKLHLPPDAHATFEGCGVLVSSFVPRPLDFHPDAVPCPYPHSSVDCDELIFYVDGEFLSRRGIEAGSLTLHPAGIPHGPALGAYEASPGRTHVDETAVMLDVTRPLRLAAFASEIEDGGYHGSYVEGV